MLLEDNFDFLESDVIRLRGRRIGLEHIVERHLAGERLEDIAAYFGDLSLEYVYATITYYLRNKAVVDAYLTQLAAFVGEQMRNLDAPSTPTAQRLRTAKPSSACAS